MGFRLIKIEGWEVNLCIISQLFCKYHFAVWSLSKCLIMLEVLMVCFFFAKTLRRTMLTTFTNKPYIRDNTVVESPNHSLQLSIWILATPSVDLLLLLYFIVCMQPKGYGTVKYKVARFSFYPLALLFSFMQFVEVLLFCRPVVVHCFSSWSKYEICNFLRRISSRFPFSDLRYRWYSSRRERKRANIAFFLQFFTAARWVMVVSIIGDREVDLRVRLHISFIGQFVMPATLEYLFGARDVEIRLACTFG